MSSQEDLKNLRILVTRPQPQGQLLCQQIRAYQGIPIYFPTIEILPPEDIPAFHKSISRLDQFDWLIFVSPQAVYQTAALIHALWPKLPAKLKLAGIGAGTAAVLRDAKLPVAVYPQEEWNSEGLLNLPEFHQVNAKNIAIVCGEGGRDLLFQELIARGASLTRIIAYQRCLPSIDVNPYLDLLSKTGIDMIICTSKEGLQNLKLLLKDAWSTLQSIPILLISERLTETAKQLGFKSFFIAKNASFDAILQAIVKQRKNL